MPQELDLFLNETAFTQAPATSVADFSQAELGKALAFHRTIPGYAPTPLTALDRLAAHFGLRSLYVKDESQRFGLKAFKALGGAYAAEPAAREFKAVSVTPSVAQAAMIGNPVSFPRVRMLAERFIEADGERAFQVVRVTEQQIMDAMIVANRHGHIACTQGGECLAGLMNAKALGLISDKEHAVLDATAHALKFAGFQDMYFNDSFPPEYGVAPDKSLANKPELLLPESARTGREVAEFARMGADAVAERLSLQKK